MKGSLANNAAPPNYTILALTRINLTQTTENGVNTSIISYPHSDGNQRPTVAAGND